MSHRMTNDQLPKYDWKIEFAHNMHPLRQAD